MNKQICLTFTQEKPEDIKHDIEMILNRFVRILDDRDIGIPILRVYPPKGMSSEVAAEIISPPLTERLEKYRKWTGDDIKFQLDLKEGYFFLTPHKTVDSGIRLRWAEHKHRDEKKKVPNVKVIDDLLILNEDYKVIPFFYSDTATFFSQSDEVKSCFYYQFFNEDGELSPTGLYSDSKRVVTGLLDIQEVGHEQLALLRPFMASDDKPKKVYPWGELMEGHDSTILLKVKPNKNNLDEPALYSVIRPVDPQHIKLPMNFFEKLDEVYRAKCCPETSTEEEDNETNE